MRLIQAAGLHIPPKEIPERIMQGLVQEADGFLRGGGAPTLEEWRNLTDAEKGALVAAGDRIRDELAGKIGLAAQGRKQAAAVAASADGGAAATRADLEERAAAIAARAEAASVEAPAGA